MGAVPRPPAPVPVPTAALPTGLGGELALRGGPCMEVSAWGTGDPSTRPARSLHLSKGRDVRVHAAYVRVCTRVHMCVCVGAAAVWGRGCCRGVGC